MQFFVHVRAVTYRLAYFAFDDFTKAPAQPVDGYLYCAFIQTELLAGVGLGNSFGVAGQPGFERVELVRLPRGLVVLSDGGKSPIKERERPFAIELAVGTGGVRVSKLQAGRGVSPREFDRKWALT